MRRSPHGRACRCGCPNSRPSGRTRPPRPRGRTRRPPRRQQPQLSTQSRQVTISAQIQKSSIIESQVPINENRPHFWLINIRMVRKIHLPNYMVNLVGLTLILGVPLSAQFCLGTQVLGRIGRTAGQDGGTSKLKSTRPRSATTRYTL